MIKLEIGKYYLDKTDFAKLQYIGKRNGVETFKVCALDDSCSVHAARTVMPDALNHIECWHEEKAWSLLYLSVNLIEEIKELITKEKNIEDRDSGIYNAVLRGLARAHNLGERCKND